MNRNTISQFSQIEAKTIPRSKLDLSQNIKYTCNFGDIVPFYVQEILPHDTMEMNENYVARMATPIYPVMDNAYLDLYFFFVPARLVWDHWKEFNGENNTDYWTQKTEYTVPQLRFSAKPEVGTIADYMGIPLQFSGVQGDHNSVSALPFRAYAKIFNDWFRNENTTMPAVVTTSDVSQTANNGDSNANPMYAELGGKCLKASKFHDYFTSCLPAPQKGDPVRLSLQQDVPVITGEEHWDTGLIANGQPIGIYSNTTLPPTGNKVQLGITLTNNSEPDRATVVSVGNPVQEGIGNEIFYFDNLVAKTSELAAATVNDLRMAFAVQRMLELDARSGTRYIEILQAHFGVTSSDARLQRSEYLGGFRKLINMQQVVQTSSTDTTSPLGQTGAFSLTSEFNQGEYVKSFEEHGFIIGVSIARTQHTYQQGIEKFWTRKNRFDFYDPIFDNIGEQPVYNKEIFAQGNQKDAEVFGYQEAWADYRTKPDRVAGYFRSGIEGGSLDAWSYADYYKEVPRLDSIWMREPVENVDRTLAVSSEKSHQLIIDMQINAYMTRPMKTHSEPGLIDHN